jgi:uncharacterized protein (DUF1778 family)
MTKRETRSEIIITRVTLRQKNIADTAAERLGISTSELCREAIFEKAAKILLLKQSAEKTDLSR